MATNQWTKGKLTRFGFITTILILLLAEAIFRIIFYFEYRGLNTSLYVQGNSLQMNDPVLVFRNRPFYVDYYRRFQFNERGMKSIPGDVFIPKKNKKDFWVLLSGGSTMEGMGSNKDGEWLDITGVSDYPASETISALLEKILKKQMPDKNVRVFNGANSGYTLKQSILRCRQLMSQYSFDWIISMDGQNEVAELQPGQMPLDIVRKQWMNNPLFRFPYNIIIPLTSHSALVNMMKQGLFHVKQTARLRSIKKKDYPRQQYWLTAKVSPVIYTSQKTVQRAVDLFYSDLKEFDSLLKQQQQQHLLLIQPTLILRDSAAMNNTEKALYHYFQFSHNEPGYNTFLKEVAITFEQHIPREDDSIELLEEMHHLPQPVFVDYCHFTGVANDYIATRIAQHILTHPAPPD